MRYPTKVSRRTPTPGNLSVSRLPAIVAIATLATALGGCQSVQLPSLPNFNASSGPAPVMEPAQLPTFHVGDKYYYSNGAREQVVSIDGETVNKISVSGRKLTDFRNFILPQPYAEGSTKEYFAATNSPTNVLWPLSVGKSERFSTEGRTVTKETGNASEYMQRWQCEIAGTEHIRVLAGEFDTYRVECKRYSVSNTWWQNRTWYYAPSIGTYVLRRDFYKSSGEYIRELTAVRPSLDDLSDDVRQNVIHTWQDALENKQSGETKSWTDKKTKTSVQVEPLQTYRAQNGQFCRTYKQYLTRKEVTRFYTGVACRTGKLKWRTPSRG
ncbi:MAG TPA: hypothetical protein VIN57_05030 [Magnetovibrio sp.]